MGFQIQCDEEQYRIVGPEGEEGELVEFGEPASLVIESGPNAGSYTAYCPDADQEEWEPPEGQLFKGEQIPVEITEVEFEYQEEDDEDGEDDAGETEGGDD